MRVDSLAIQPVSQPSLPVSSLTELLTQLNSVSIKLRQRPTAPERRTGELAAAEYAVLNIIHRTGALTVPQIARERSTSRQNIQILVPHGAPIRTPG